MNRWAKACAVVEGLWVLIGATVAVVIAVKVFPVWSGLRLAQGMVPYLPVARVLCEAFWVLLAVAGLLEAATLYAVVVGGTAAFGLWSSRLVGAYASLLLSGWWVVLAIVEALILSTLNPWRIALVATRLALASVLLARPVWRTLQ